MIVIKIFFNYIGNSKTGLFLFVLLQVVFTAEGFTQQTPDTAFHFSIRQSAYKPGMGPAVLIDTAHHNFHTREGGFYPFSKLLEQDGYRVRNLDNTITDATMSKDCKILVIVNALNDVNADNWTLPTPSAFTPEEIAVVKHWVGEGGSLLLIADHMPFAGAATELGKAFGFEFINGFARTGERFWPPTVFSSKNGSLHLSPVTTGSKEYERIDSVATFTGSAFRAPEGSTSVLSFSGSDISLQPDTAWRFNEHTPVQTLGGFSQGSLLRFGKGRVAVFGEAAMFTAQLVNGNMPVGFNSDYAPQNAQFTLNLIHWLDGVKEYRGSAR